MNNCCPSYATKALHLANEQSWMIENPNRPVYMCFAIIKCGYFSPEVKKPQSSLYWDYIPFFVVCNYQKTSSSSTSNRMKEAKTEGKKWPSLVFVPSGHKNEAQSPWKNLEEQPICYPGCQRSSRSPAARSVRASSACRRETSGSGSKKSFERVNPITLPVISPESRFDPGNLIGRLEKRLLEGLLLVKCPTILTKPVLQSFP